MNVERRWKPYIKTHIIDCANSVFNLKFGKGYSCNKRWYSFKILKSSGIDKESHTMELNVNWLRSPEPHICFGGTTLMELLAAQWFELFYVGNFRWDKGLQEELWCLYDLSKPFIKPKMFYNTKLKMIIFGLWGRKTNKKLKCTISRMWNCSRYDDW